MFSRPITNRTRPVPFSLLHSTKRRSSRWMASVSGRREFWPRVRQPDHGDPKATFSPLLRVFVNSGEYKLMGLAPYGRPRYVQLIREKLIDLKEDGSFRIDLDA